MLYFHFSHLMGLPVGLRNSDGYKRNVQNKRPQNWGHVKAATDMKGNRSGILNKYESLKFVIGIAFVCSVEEGVD